MITAWLLLDGESIKRASLTDDGIGDLYTDLPDDIISAAHTYRLIDGMFKKVITDDGNLIVPAEITKLQASRYLRRTGRYNELMSLLDSDPTGNARADWNDSSTFRRKDQMILTMGVAFGLDSAGIDQFFVEAFKENTEEE